jgi:hypothetical protein
VCLLTSSTVLGIPPIELLLENIYVYMLALFSFWLLVLFLNN